MAADIAITTGKVIAVKDGLVLFRPRNTNYELHLRTEGQYAGVLNAPVDARIRATGRKVWTVPSGGNFVVPIMGSPRIVQGRVKSIGEREIIVHAGGNFIIALPSADSAIDLPNGPISVNTMVNVTIMPGASIEFIPEPATGATPVSGSAAAAAEPAAVR